jgi:hypothetical protein
MARASTYTLLSLDRYARIMGINPPHFNQGGSTEFFKLESRDCRDAWFQHDWQNSKVVGRESLARAIRQAEDDIAMVIGYYPAPRWISKEMHRYPQLYRRGLYGNGKDIRWKFKSIEARWGKFIAAGRRNVAQVGDSVAVAYSDPNSVGFSDTATITVAGITTTDECELKVYFEDHNGEQEWEIRDPRSKTLVAGTLTVIFDSWQLIDPDLWEAYPTTQALEPIDFTDTANLITNVDVYREFTDFTQASAEFSFEPKPRTDSLSFLCTSCNGTGCVACELTIQTGCAHPRDVELGLIVPQPATFSVADDQWNEDQWTECREPDNVKLWYYAGDLDERFLRETSCDPLSHWFAEAIAWLATARLSRDICGCSNIVEFARDLRRDLSHTPSDGDSFFLSDDNLANPFGTRRGEVMAWNRIANLTEHVPDLALA